MKSSEPAEEFESLFQSESPIYFRILCRMGLSDQAEDVIQEAFVKAWRSWDDFQKKSERKTWLMRIVLNQAKDSLRQRKSLRFSQRVLSDVDQLSSPEARSYETKELVRRAFESLSSEHREILTLMAFEGLSSERVAEILDLPEGSVRSRLHYARKAFRKFFDSQNEWPNSLKEKPA